MARLPTADALGVVNNAGSGGPMSSIQTGAMGEGVAALARGAGNLGDALFGLGKQKEAFDARIATSSATTRMLKEYNDFQNYTRDNPDDYQNFEKNFQERMDRARNEVANTIQDPKQRALWATQQAQLNEQWKQRTATQAWTRQRDSYMGQTQKDIDDLRNLALDPNLSDEDRKMHIETAGDMIEDARRRGFISDQEAAKWRDNWQKGYAVSRLEMMPAAQRVTALTATKHATPELAQSIQAAAKTLGISPQDLATVISYETAGTFDPWKAGPTTQWGQHRGLIQWGEPQRKKYGVYEGMPVADQLQSVVAYLKDAGVKPGMGLLDVYSAINAGRVGRYNASDAGNGGAPGTVADKVNFQMEGHKRKALALLGGQAIDPIAQMVPPDQRERLLTRAQAEAERDTESEKITVKQLMADDTNSLLATGKGVEGLTYDRIKNSISKDEADKWQAARSIAQKTHENTKGMEDMTDDQIRAHAERFRPGDADAGEGFTEKATVYSNVNTRAQEILKARAEDPAASVDASPPVRAARDALSKENSLANREALIAARLKQQELFGVPQYNRSPISVAEAKSYAAKMRPLARGQADAANQNEVIEGIVGEIEQTYGKYAKDVMTRVLYQVILKRDAAEVLSNAVRRMQTTDSGALVTVEEQRRVEQGNQARSIADMGGYVSSPGDLDVNPGDDGMQGPPMKYPTPPSQALKRLESDPAKYMPFFIQKYGVQAIPRSLRMGPQADEMTPKAK